MTYLDIPVGLCAPTGQHDPDLWFSTVERDTLKAKRICGECPVRVSCLEGAIERGEPAGIWGGVRFGRAILPVREWAADVGIVLPRNGRIPQYVYDAYDEARQATERRRAS